MGKWWHKILGNFASIVIDIEDCSKINAHAICERASKEQSIEGRWTAVDNKKVNKEERSEDNAVAWLIGFIINCLWLSGCCLCCCCCGQAPWLKDEWWEGKPAEPAVQTVTTITPINQMRAISPNPLGMVAADDATNDATDDATD